MAKNTNQKKDLSGIDSYRYEDLKIRPCSCFLYELVISKIWENGFCMLRNKFIKSNKQLIETPRIIRHKNYIIVKYTALLGAPMEFIIDNKLSKYDPKSKTLKKIKNGRKKSNTR